MQLYQPWVHTQQNWGQITMTRDSQQPCEAAQVLTTGWMELENVAYIHNGVCGAHWKEQNPIFFRKIGEASNCVKQSKVDAER